MMRPGVIGNIFDKTGIFSASGVPLDTGTIEVDKVFTSFAHPVTDPTLPAPWQAFSNNLEGSKAHITYWHPTARVWSSRRPSRCADLNQDDIYGTMMDAGLPKPWHGAVDEASGRVFYWNSATCVATWSMPGHEAIVSW